jgi:hypothetical protein
MDGQTVQSRMGDGIVDLVVMNYGSLAGFSVSFVPSLSADQHSDEMTRVRFLRRLRHQSFHSMTTGDQTLYEGRCLHHEISRFATAIDELED